jgi:hypothetical protein
MCGHPLEIVIPSEARDLLAEKENAEQPRQMKVKLPLLSSDPGGVRKPSFHGARH